MIVLDQTNANIERHIKTHSVRSGDDRAAVEGGDFGSRWREG